MTMNNEAALVVFSGGQDSTTCLFWAKKHFKEVYALSFIYGQKHVKEVELARRNSREGRSAFSCNGCIVHRSSWQELSYRYFNSDGRGKTGRLFP